MVIILFIYVLWVADSTSPKDQRFEAGFPDALSLTTVGISGMAAIRVLKNLHMGIFAVACSRYRVPVQFRHNL